MSKKRNKSYKPKRVDRFAFETTVKLVKPIDDNAKIKFSLDNREAIQAFLKGVANTKHFNTLARTVDVTLLMLNAYFQDAKELKEEVAQGWLAMIRARDRVKTLNAFGFDGPAKAEMQRVCEIFEEVLNNITGAEFIKCCQLREEQIARGNYFKGTAADAPARIAA